MTTKDDATTTRPPTATPDEAHIQARNDGKIDLLADFAEPLPAIVTAEMLGVPVEDHNQLKKWSVTFAEMLGNFQHNPDRLPAVLVAVEGLCAYFHDAIKKQRDHPRDDESLRLPPQPRHHERRLGPCADDRVPRRPPVIATLASGAHS